VARRAPLPDDAGLRGRLAAEGLSAIGWSNGPGDRYAVHEHGYDKVLVAVRGSIGFLLDDGARIDLAAGDRLDLPSGTSHGALVGRSGVSCLEAHLPAGSLPPVPRLHARWGLPDPAGPTEG